MRPYVLLVFAPTQFSNPKKNTIFLEIGAAFHYWNWSMVTTMQYQRYGLVWKHNPRICVYVEGKSWGREILCTLGSPFGRPKPWMIWKKLRLYARISLNLYFPSTELSNMGWPPQVSLILGLGEVWWMKLVNEKVLHHLVWLQQCKQLTVVKSSYFFEFIFK